MGAIAFVRSWLTGNRRASLTIRGDQPVTGDNFNQPGDDCQALPGDAVLFVPLSDRGSRIIVAAVDNVNKPKALPGEKRVYSRSANGTVKAELWLKSTGAVELSNAAGSVELSPAGVVTINGVIFSPAGTITVGGLTISSAGIAGAGGGPVAIGGASMDASGNITTLGEITAGPAALKLTRHYHPTAPNGPTSPPGGNL